MNLHEWTKDDLYARVLELEAELDSVRFERDSARYMRDVYRANHLAALQSAQAEREACAKLCDDAASGLCEACDEERMWQAMELANKIRNMDHDGHARLFPLPPGEEKR